MKPLVLKGRKQDIAKAILGLPGDVREVIVFAEEPAERSTEGANGDIFAEMEPYEVHVGDADFSREAIYTRMPDE